ncbi:subclass B3 metallo-beta-lactamase [Phenylobacterium sp.]|uniref:subclass B3 metallo-beta-lactamase n=1 Tax=Phenylobacterium sp. TaxID=1871053 RepID=UPI00286C151F|nr:subclass B3 metallo-beta-lactamase [Phenylobacterium sp.]
MAAALAFSGSNPAQAAPHDNDPMAPFEIADGVYYVGASDIASYLFKTKGGLILLDGGYDTTAPQILANIRTLGFDPKAIKILLSTHGHLDHAGGLAQLKRETGATLYASPLDGALMARGGKGDFGLKDRAPYPPVTPDRTLVDGQAISLGGVTMTAHLTPGHTRGCTTWTLPVRVAGRLRQALILCSNSILPPYRLDAAHESYPGIAADYEKSYAFWRSAPCEVFLGSHGIFFDMQAKRAALLAGKTDAFVDPAGCKTWFDKGYVDFKATLASQQSEAAL